MCELQQQQQSPYRTLLMPQSRQRPRGAVSPGTDLSVSEVIIHGEVALKVNGEKENGTISTT
jgi:hypothetical protein